MKKILITIYVLSIGEQYDLFVPIDMKVIQVINLIQKSIHDLSGGDYVIKNDNEIILSDYEGKVINPNNIVKFSGLRNGCKVIMK